jgi:hypothetical protein
MMLSAKIFWAKFLIWIAMTSIVPACLWSSKANQGHNSIQAGMESPAASTPQQAAPKMNGSPAKLGIRNVDFNNFTFPKLPSGKCSSASIRLTNGHYETSEEKAPRKIPSIDCWSVDIGQVSYGDVTGDGNEEAFVTLYAELGGNSGYLDVYIYSLSEGKPVLLWKFMTGDRGNGGLRSIYSESGELAIELYGVGGNVTGQLDMNENKSNAEKQLNSKEFAGDCCAKHFTRTKYKWSGKRFQQSGEEEVLPNSSGSTEIIIR